MKLGLLLIDVINDFDFDEADQMLPAARRAAKCISKLKSEASRYRIPSIYVNDNFGRWQSDFRAQVRHCLSESARGCSIVQTLQPEESDYFVLKPKHSGFYSTNLEVLLQHLQIDSLILTGFAGNICVMFTANDAYMRNYKLFVPAIVWHRILMLRTASLWNKCSAY